VITLRPATNRDAQFVDDLTFKTMRPFVQATWPNDAAAQQHYFAMNSFNVSNTRIIQVDGQDAGRLSTTVRSDCLFIDEIHILPEYQRQGIGKQTIDRVLDEARQRGLPVEATVLKVNNPSLRMFLGIGFQIRQEKDHRFHIQYTATR